MRLHSVYKAFPGATWLVRLRFERSRLVCCRSRDKMYSVAHNESDPSILLEANECSSALERYAKQNSK